jgi:hypothetical protein
MANPDLDPNRSVTMQMHPGHCRHFETVTRHANAVLSISILTIPATSLRL